MAIMTRSTQKQREVNAVQNLRNTFPGFPRQARIESVDDPLDVKVVLPSGRCIGIEVTDFVRDRSTKGSQLDSFQKLTRQIVLEAEVIYARRHAPPRYSHIYFSRNIRCPTNGIVRYAERLAWQVAQVADNISDPLPIERGLPAGVDKIIVYPGAMPGPQFAPVYSNSWEYLTDAHIDEILTSKEPKIPTYRAKCDEVWLLIYVDGDRMSGWVEPPLSLRLHGRSTSFDRVFFLYDAARVIEVVLRG
jgi:hypothetical protein